jgi:hypothetical protein
MKPSVSVEAVVQNLNGHLVLFIPLDEGGSALRWAARGISDTEGRYLKLTMPTWLVESVGATRGSRVIVEAIDGRLNIRLK